MLRTQKPDQIWSNYLTEFLSRCFIVVYCYCITDALFSPIFSFLQDEPSWGVLKDNYMLSAGSQATVSGSEDEEASEEGSSGSDD